MRSSVPDSVAGRFLRRAGATSDVTGTGVFAVDDCVVVIVDVVVVNADVICVVVVNADVICVNVVTDIDVFV
jgi:hypothetical protein